MTPNPLAPRLPRLALDRVRKHWLANSVAATHVANGVNLLFPAGERFFIRSVRRYLDDVGPELRAQVRGFFGQEGRHAQAHERVFETLRAQGYDVDAILERYETVAYEHIEHWCPPLLRLAVTAACEHFTAILAEDALGADGLAFADAPMRQLLEWHAVEELEHKAVAFDVLRQVNPSYALRVAGLAVATLTLGGFWAWATYELLKQDGVSLREAARDLEALKQAALAAGRTKAAEPVATRVFARGIREYLRRDFHPNDRDHRDLVRRTLERLAAEGVIAEAPLAA